jgi:beta-glucosidase
LFPVRPAANLRAMISRFLRPALFVTVSSLAVAAAPGPGLFVNPRAPAAIYHDGWIDLNKNGEKDPYEDPARDVEARVNDLLARMSLEEKTAQMVTLYGYPRVAKDELPTEAWKTAFWHDGIGNIDEHINGNGGSARNVIHYDLPYSLHARALNEVQRFFIEDTRLGVPADFTNEGIRGLLHSKATSFPAQIGVASAFDRELVREIGRITGREGRALGYTNVYSPILEVARDPRWGRIVESYGEDPFLVSELGVEETRGIQEQRVVSTLKHFAVYSVPKGGRDGDARTDPQVTWREVETVFLAPFRRAVRDGGALGIMASYNDYDGVPIEGNSLFLTDILRREFGFKGYVVSDSGAVEFIHLKHHVAPTPADAIRQSVEAGLNIRTNFTPPEAYANPLRELVRTGALPMAVIDERVREILRVKYWLGLLDQPYVMDPAATDKVVRAPAHLAIADRAAHESIILLRNENGALPLKREALKKILVTGPLADNARGWASRYGPQKLDFITPLAGLKAKLGSAVEVRYVEGCAVKDEHFPESDVYKASPSPQVRAGIDEAVNAARDVDVIVAVLGETDELCRESASRTSLALPGYQEELLEALQATGKPLVLVLSNGRPLSVYWAAHHVPAIVELWFPGEAAGTALSDVLLGDYNPSGRLPVTVPKSVGQIPFNFPTHPGAQGRDPGQVSGPLYPFGFGLSYTKFSYANLKITPERVTADKAITVAVDVTNSGARAGDEVVQLYLRDDYSSVTTWEKELRGFARVSLAPGETKTVHFELTPEQLQLYNRDGKWVVEPGRFTIMIGASSEDVRLRGNFTVTRPDGTAPEEAPVRDVRIDPV